MITKKDIKYMTKVIKEHPEKLGSIYFDKEKIMFKDTSGIVHDTGLTRRNFPEDLRDYMLEIALNV